MSSPIEMKSNELIEISAVIYDHAEKCATCRKKLDAIISDAAFEILDKMIEARQLRNYIQTNELGADKEEDLSTNLHNMILELRKLGKVLCPSDHAACLDIAQHAVPTMTIYYR